MEKTVEREASRILFLSKFEPVDEVKKKEMSRVRNTCGEKGGACRL